uniref:Serpentine receptor class gamma n=1 Tax=Caenorhabditis tropicalis TaxID=1561998 RepID=A0A1I7TAQ3_9PELO
MTDVFSPEFLFIHFNTLFHPLIIFILFYCLFYFILNFGMDHFDTWSERRPRHRYLMAYTAQFESHALFYLFLILYLHFVFIVFRKSEEAYSNKMFLRRIITV